MDVQTANINARTADRYRGAQSARDIFDTIRSAPAIEKKMAPTGMCFVHEMGGRKDLIMVNVHSEEEEEEA